MTRIQKRKPKRDQQREATAFEIREKIIREIVEKEAALGGRVITVAAPTLDGLRTRIIEELSAVGSKIEDIQSLSYSPDRSSLLSPYSAALLARGSDE